MMVPCLATLEGRQTLAVAHLGHSLGARYNHIAHLLSNPRRKLAETQTGHGMP